MSIVEEFSKYVVELNFAKLPREILEPTKKAAVLRPESLSSRLDSARPK